MAGTVAGLVLPAGMVVAGVQHARPDGEFPLRAGVAWLASNQTGQLTLVDGASAEVAARVTVGRPGSSLQALQSGSTGFAVNRSDGSVARVDGATFQVSRQPGLLPTSGTNLWAFAAGDAVLAFDSRRGVLAAADAHTLTPRDQRMTLAAGAGPEATAVDGAGGLWVLDPVSGDLVWSAGSQRRSRPAASTPARTVLTTTGGNPVLVDPVRQRAELLDRNTGTVRGSIGLDRITPGGKVIASGTADGHRLYVVDMARSELLICRFDTGSCASPVRLDRHGWALGAPVEARGRVLVPNYFTRSVAIIDPAAGRVVTELAVLGRLPRTGTRPFELLARDGVVFVNDPDSDQADVLGLDGQVRTVRKYLALGRGGAGGTSRNDQLAKPPSRRHQIPATHGPPAGPGMRPEPIRSGRDGMASGVLSIEVKPGLHVNAFQDVTLTVRAKSAHRVTKARWSFGDGTLVPGISVRHRWTKAGGYRVRVTATLDDGRSAMASRFLQVGNAPKTGPTRIALLEIERDQDWTGVPVTFRAVTTGSLPRRWVWTVRGPAALTRNTPGFTRSFDAAGRYRVSLTVTGGGGSDTASKEFTVDPRPEDHKPGTEVKCGQRIRSSITLTKNLDCPGTGLYIDADHVTINLNNKRLNGNGKAPGLVLRGVRGNPVRDITINNGEIVGFKVGVELSRVDHVTLDKLRLTNNKFAGSEDPDDGGILLTETRRVTISGAVIKGSEYAILDRKPNEGTTINGDTRITNGRIHLMECGADLSIENNRRLIEEHGNPGVRDSVIIANCVRLSLRNNVISGRRLEMWSLSDSDVVGNTMTRSPWGNGIFLLGEDSVRVTGNRFIQNSVTGLEVEAPPGSSSSIELTRNSFIDNGSREPRGEDTGGLDVHIWEADGELPPSTATAAVSLNTAKGNNGFDIRARGVVNSVRGSGNTVWEPGGCIPARLCEP